MGGTIRFPFFHFSNLFHLFHLFNFPFSIFPFPQNFPFSIFQISIFSIFQNFQSFLKYFPCFFAPKNWLGPTLGPLGPLAAWQAVWSKIANFWWPRSAKQ